VRELTRLIPFIWPQRRKFLLSCVFGVIVALMWGGNLTVIYPIMQVLLKEKTLQTYVAEELASARAKQATEHAELRRLETEKDQLRAAGAPDNSPQYLKVIAQLSEHQDELESATEKESRMLWVRPVVMAPWFPTTEYRTFLFIIILVMISTLTKGVFQYLQDVMVGDCSEAAMATIRKKLFRKMLQLDYQTFAKEGPARLLSKFTHDTELLSLGMSVVGGRFVREPLKCIACAGIAMWFNWRLTMLSLMILPVIGVVFAVLGKALKRAARRMMESVTRIYQILEESFDGIKAVIAFDTAHRHRQRFEKEYQNYFNKARRVVRLDAFAKPTMEMLGVTALFIALLPGAYLVLRQKTSIYGIQLAPEPMTVGQLGVLYALIAGMLDPCRRMNASVSRLRRAMTALERILQTLDSKPQIRNLPESIPLARHHESIEFRNITFRYEAREKEQQRGPVLTDFNLKVKAGEVIAIVGHNGCGKSTLVQLLPRFFDPQSGDILIDGVPIQSATLQSLRGQIGLVTQETILFDMTLRENITYGSNDVSQDRLDAAAQQAHLGPILKQLPLGYDTPLGDRGKSLSGGQRQRVALARAILRDPSILILDEATSATDAESEMLIHQTLKSFVKGRTVMLITHSMSQSLLDFVTRVVVMDHGQVVADGSHAQLLATCPLYQRLFQAPSRREAA
jgi:subfamily B ATP-binding cassette protein MsbA